MTAQKLASVQIVIDKLHMEGHVDKWCLTNCDPHLFHDLDKVSVYPRMSQVTIYICMFKRLTLKFVSKLFPGSHAIPR